MPRRKKQPVWVAPAVIVCTFSSVLVYFSISNGYIYDVKFKNGDVEFQLNGSPGNHSVLK
jgi:hypothetical protein